MEKSASLFLLVLLSTAVLNSAATALHKTIPAAGLGRELTNKHLKKSGGGAGLRIPEKGRKIFLDGDESMAGKSLDINGAASTAMVMPTLWRGEEEYQFSEKNFKFCLTPGPCHKKRLVCPKKCISSRVENVHATNPCAFDCTKCVAHCTEV